MFHPEMDRGKMIQTMCCYLWVVREPVSLLRRECLGIPYPDRFQETGRFGENDCHSSEGPAIESYKIKKRAIESPMILARCGITNALGDGVSGTTGCQFWDIHLPNHQFCNSWDQNNHSRQYLIQHRTPSNDESQRRLGAHYQTLEKLQLTF